MTCPDTKDQLALVFPIDSAVDPQKPEQGPSRAEQGMTEYQLCDQAIERWTGTERRTFLRIYPHKTRVRAARYRVFR